MLVHPSDPSLHLFEAVDLDRVAADEDLGPARAIRSWARTFLATPHPELGRAGNVCPFAGPALDADTFRLAVDASRPASADDLTARVLPYFEWLPHLEPREGPGADTRAVLVLFPRLSGSETMLIEEVGASLRPAYFERGFVVGRYRPESEHGSVRNDAFRPLRSPVPMLGLRPMVADDLPLLVEDDMAFLHWYRRFSDQLPDDDRETAMRRAQELDLRSDS